MSLILFNEELFFPTEIDYCQVQTFPPSFCFFFYWKFLLQVSFFWFIHMKPRFAQDSQCGYFYVSTLWLASLDSIDLIRFFMKWDFVIYCSNDFHKTSVLSNGNLWIINFLLTKSLYPKSILNFKYIIHMYLVIPWCKL